MEKLYKYGMRERPVDIGAQPNGFYDFDESDNRYWNVIYYGRKLSPEETEHYNMDFLGVTDDGKDF